MAGLQCKVVKLLPCPDALEEDLGEHEIEAGNVTLVCIGSKKTVDGTTDYSPVAGPSCAAARAPGGGTAAARCRVYWLPAQTPLVRPPPTPAAAASLRER